MTAMPRDRHSPAQPGDDVDRLPGPIEAALATLAPGAHGTRSVIVADGTPYATESWGRSSGPPVLLLHGVTSASGIWWRVGPALAAAGYRVIAPDLPGHGRTGAWRGRFRFRETAADVAAFIDAAGLVIRELAVVGHSWGGMVTAALPAAGVRPRVLVLLDPPALPLPYLEAMARDPTERRYTDIAEAVAVIGAANPGWSEGDLLAKAEGLTQFAPDAALQILLANGDWDGGLADLADPAARDEPAFFIRGDPAVGGLVPDAAVPAIERRVGAGRLTTLVGAPHSPMRTHLGATVNALLRALEG
jgi:pimeloyl-ACP methyl ester carboxylesterase